MGLLYLYLSFYSMHTFLRDRRAVCVFVFRPPPPPSNSEPANFHQIGYASWPQRPRNFQYPIDRDNTFLDERTSVV
jgi:hypothetical protein